ncbi:MAG: c-type cytochrome [bacterium]|nr:c-type cytochrome [Candidatus Kapabacteria bacterium]
MYLVPASAKLDRVNHVPRDPSMSSFDDAIERSSVVKGFNIVRSTREHAPELAGNAFSCGNCHLNVGQRAHSLPLVGVASRYPQFCDRENRQVGLADQVIDCAQRHLNARVDDRESQSVTDVVAYITWLSKDIPSRYLRREDPPIDPSAFVPVSELNPARGADLYAKKCSQCHGADGQGVDLAIAHPGPLWGPESWSDGGDAARIYVLASFIRRSMPLLNPGAMTDEEAQQIAAYINAQERPRYAAKQHDYRGSTIPVDAVYYKQTRARITRASTRQ